MTNSRGALFGDGDAAFGVSDLSDVPPPGGTGVNPLPGCVAACLSSACRQSVSICLVGWGEEMRYGKGWGVEAVSVGTDTRHVLWGGRTARRDSREALESGHPRFGETQAVQSRRGSYPNVAASPQNASSSSSRVNVPIVFGVGRARRPSHGARMCAVQTQIVPIRTRTQTTEPSEKTKKDIECENTEAQVTAMRALLVTRVWCRDSSGWVEAKQVAARHTRRSSLRRTRNGARHNVVVFVASNNEKNFPASNQHPRETPLRAFPDPFGFADKVDARVPNNAQDVPLDLLPVPQHRRTWTAWDMMGLWIGKYAYFPFTTIHTAQR